MGERQTFLRTVLAATKGPTRLGLLLIALAIALPMTALPTAIASVVARVLTLATICLLGWIALTALHIGADLYLRRFRLDLADNLLARKHITQVRVLERILEVVIVILTIGFALLTFDSVRHAVRFRRRRRHHRRACGSAGVEQLLCRHTACGRATDSHR